MHRIDRWDYMMLKCFYRARMLAEQTAYRMENTSFPAILKMVLISKTTKSNKIKPQNPQMPIKKWDKELKGQVHKSYKQPVSILMSTSLVTN